MKIAIDVDDIIADFIPSLIRFHNSVYGTSLRFDNFTSRKFWTIWGGTKKSDIEKIFSFYKTVFFKNIKPLKGAQEGIKNLKKRHELFIITSRESPAKKETLNWISKYFPNMFSEIFFTENGKGKRKYDICKEVNIDVIIEDDVDNIIECSRNGIKVIAIDYPWNKIKSLPENVHKVNSWVEIVDLLKQPKRI